MPILLVCLCLGQTDPNFIGAELLGRPTDTSVTVHVIPAVQLDSWIEFTTNPKNPGSWSATPVVSASPQSPVPHRIDNLSPDTRYYYRLVYCLPPDCVPIRRPVRTFHTQRPPGASFVFCVQGDSHLQNALHHPDPAESARRMELYGRTAQLAANDRPDFCIDVGDTMQTEMYLEPGDAQDLQQTLQRHYDQRPFFEAVCHSAALFLVLGNHEGEQGWRLLDPGDHVAEWATQARLLTYPNPDPMADTFYTGNLEGTQNYYAFHWGDALFVTLDPYRYTTVKPHHRPNGEIEDGSEDNWDWTLGTTQYLWLKDTLESSAATFKFVFAHQITGGSDTGLGAYYGRGGADVAHKYEWGGRNIDSSWGFHVRRPGWEKPIHQLLAENNVAVFFHGHDHFFAWQVLDGVIYQEIPQPSDSNYETGHDRRSEYRTGILLENAGHLRVRVRPEAATVEYVRSYLDGEGPHGSVQLGYDVTDCNSNGIPDTFDFLEGLNPNEGNPGCFCPVVCADLNHNGQVELSDFATFVGCFGVQDPARCACADLDSNGRIDFADMGLFASRVGMPGSPCE